MGATPAALPLSQSRMLLYRAATFRSLGGAAGSGDLPDDVPHVRVDLDAHIARGDKPAITGIQRGRGYMFPVDRGVNIVFQVAALQGAGSADELLQLIPGHWHAGVKNRCGGALDDTSLQHVGQFRRLVRNVGKPGSVVGCQGIAARGSRQSSEGPAQHHKGLGAGDDPVLVEAAVRAALEDVAFYTPGL